MSQMPSPPAHVDPGPAGTQPPPAQTWQSGHATHAAPPAPHSSVEFPAPHPPPGSTHELQQVVHGAPASIGPPSIGAQSPDEHAIGMHAAVSGASGSRMSATAPSTGRSNVSQSAAYVMHEASRAEAENE